jgi:hypothetical protein
MIDNKPVPLRCVLFDLDGTLLDTAPDLGAAVNHVLVSEGFAPLSDAIIRQTTSHGALGLLKAGLGDELLEELGATRLRTALLDYVLDLLERSRRQPAQGHPLSPRAGLALVAAARAWSLLEGRDHVIPDDVQAVLAAVCEHRMDGGQRGGGSNGELSQRLQAGVDGLR